MTTTHIVDNFGNGICQVTDGVETIFLPKGRYYFNQPIYNVKGHAAQITKIIPDAPKQILMDAPTDAKNPSGDTENKKGK
jgi:hypothetical protein